MKVEVRVEVMTEEVRLVPPLAESGVGDIDERSPHDVDERCTITPHAQDEGAQHGHARQGHAQQVHAQQVHATQAWVAQARKTQACIAPAQRTHPRMSSLVFGGFAFLPFSLGPAGDCPCRH